LRTGDKHRHSTPNPPPTNQPTKPTNQPNQPTKPTQLQVYAERYHHLKAPRKLIWRPSLGAVTLEVTCGDAAVEFRVTPLHAAILLRFSGAGPGDALTASQLAAALGAPLAVVRRKALFWVSSGVLVEGRTGGGDVAYRRAEALDPTRIGARYRM